MSKEATTPADSALRRIPSVERILASAAFEPLLEEFGRERVKEALGGELEMIRVTRGEYDETAVASGVVSRLSSGLSAGLRRVVNGTGVLIHTNLGRAPIDRVILRRAEELLSGYSNLEFDLERGERGARDEHLTQICAALFGADDAILVNNNAGGTLLIVAAIAAGREVIVSRGELVEIGGAFRVPEVIEQGGAKLKEVGTTNRTRAADYEAAISRRTAALLRVHRSNFDIVGFTETPDVDELAAVARKKNVPLIYDEGSGRTVDLTTYGFRSAETVAALLGRGVDVVTCSTDKLIGATQGGLILGRHDLLSRCRRHPLLRALRAGKESYAIVSATLRSFATGKHEKEIALYRMLSAPLETLRARAATIAAGSTAAVVRSDCALGGGTTPTETAPSVAIAVPGNAASLHERFLRNDPPIVGRIVDDRFLVDVRTLMPEDDAAVQAALRASA